MKKKSDAEILNFISNHTYMLHLFYIFRLFPNLENGGWSIDKYLSEREPNIYKFFSYDKMKNGAILKFNSVFLKMKERISMKSENKSLSFRTFVVEVILIILNVKNIVESSIKNIISCSRNNLSKA